MSEANVEVVRRMYDAFYGGDAETALSHFDPEVVVDAPGRVDVDTGRGREAVAAIIGSWVAAFDDWSDEIEEMRDLGDRVQVIAVQRGRGKGTGIEVETRYAVVYEVAGDLITRMTLSDDRDESLEA